MIANDDPTEGDDLFSPTLTPDDDIQGFDRPWNPNYLPLCAFFGGFVGTSLLVWMNQARLGVRRTGLVILGVVVAFLAARAFVVNELTEFTAYHKEKTETEKRVGEYLSADPPEVPGVDFSDTRAEVEKLIKEVAAEGAEEHRGARYASFYSSIGVDDPKELKTTVSVVTRLLAVVLTVVLVRGQRRRFRLAEQFDVPNGRLIGYFFLAFGITLIVELTLAVTVVLAAR